MKKTTKIYPFNDGVLIGVNQGPSTPIKLYTDVNQPHGRFLPNSGAGRITNVRYKKGKG